MKLDVVKVKFLSGVILAAIRGALPQRDPKIATYRSLFASYLL